MHQIVATHHAETRTRKPTPPSRITNNHADVIVAVAEPMVSLEHAKGQPPTQRGEGIMGPNQPRPKRPLSER